METRIPVEDIVESLVFGADGNTESDISNTESDGSERDSLFLEESTVTSSDHYENKGMTHLTFCLKQSFT